MNATVMMPDANRQRPRINSSHSIKDRGLDAYWTPPCAVSALMRIETLPKPIADPCCGSGAILDVLSEAGHIVHGADIADYGWPATIWPSRS
jgi:hypothetical protein